MKTKICSKCDEKKSLKEFFKHPEMANGFLNKCKKCIKDEKHKYYLEKSKDPAWIENERKRCRDKYYRLGYKNKYHPKKNKINQERYRNKYPEKIKARYSAVVKKIQCPVRHHRHHWSYNKIHWGDVIILTIKEHRLLHRHMIYDQTKLMYRNAQGILLETKESHLKLLNKIKH